MADRCGIPLAVSIFPKPNQNVARTFQNPQYIREILDHAGICRDEITFDELAAALPSLRVLVTVGDGPMPEETKASMRSWVEQGGAWLSIAGTCGLDDLFGVHLERPTYTGWGGSVCDLGEGYLSTDDCPSSDDIDPLPLPLHFFGGLAVQPTTGEVRARILNAHGQPTGRPGIVDSRVGSGFCRLIAVDIPGTVVRIQQGIAVTRDGIPAPDGTAPVSDGVLKSDDGAVLDWIFDRQPVPGVEGFSAFLHPIADLWRELFLSSVFTLAGATGLALPVLWLYPRNLPAIGHLSHDTDGNTPAEAFRLLEVLKSVNTRSTWCVIEPGYSPELMAEIRSDLHEFATHYDAMSEGRAWSEAEFDRQWQFLCTLFGEIPVSNKNHYLRWEGDTEFYSWCERRGIQLDESKGASKTGEAGFNFGTCHPFFAVSPQGLEHNVLELTTPTQDLCVFAPILLLEPLMEAALQHHGILHLLFHPAHIFKAGVAEAMVEAVTSGRNNGMEWWTAAEINRWERSRRTARWRDYQVSDVGAAVTLETSDPLHEATVLWLLPPDDTSEQDVVIRWGRRFAAVSLQNEKAGAYRIETPPR